MTLSALRGGDDGGGRARREACGRSLETRCSAAVAKDVNALAEKNNFCCERAPHAQAPPQVWLA